MHSQLAPESGSRLIVQTLTKLTLNAWQWAAGSGSRDESVILWLWDRLVGEPGEYTIKEVPDTGLCETEHQREVPDHTAGGGVAKGGRSSGGQDSSQKRWFIIWLRGKPSQQGRLQLIKQKPETELVPGTDCWSGFLVLVNALCSPEIQNPERIALLCIHS